MAGAVCRATQNKMIKVVVGGFWWVLVGFGGFGWHLGGGFLVCCWGGLGGFIL